jgi:hypothetical protein
LKCACAGFPAQARFILRGKCGFSQPWEVLRPFHGAVLKILEAALHSPKKAIYAKFCATTIAFEGGICYYI